MRQWICDFAVPMQKPIPVPYDTIENIARQKGPIAELDNLEALASQYPLDTP